MGVLTIAALLLGATFYVADASVLGFLLLVPLIHSAIRAGNRLSAFLLGWWFGLVFMLTVAVWILESYSARWVHIDPVIGLGISLPIMILTSALLALCFGAFALFVFMLKPLLVREPHVFYRGLFCVSIAGVFALCEYLRMVLFALAMRGSTLAEPFFSVGFLGYLASPFSGLRALAPVADVYGLTFLLAMVNAIVGLIILYGSPKKRMRYLGITALVLITLNIGLLVFAPKKTNANIAVGGVGLSVPSGAPESEKEREATRAYTDHSAFLETAEVVVFPESFGSSVLKSTAIASTSVLVSTRVEENEHTRFLAGIFSKEGGAYLSQKRILVPYGEYLPVVALPVFEFLSPSLAARFARTLHAVPGRDDARVYALPAARMGVLFCNEAWSPSMGAVLKAQGAEVAVVMASHASFEHAFLLEVQEERMLQIRAVALRIPFVQVTNRGVSYAIDQGGAVVGRYGAGESFVAQVPYLRAP